MFEWAQSLNTANFNGFNDWYIPARYELCILYYFLKPDSTANLVTGTIGSNPYSVAPYTPNTPNSASSPVVTSSSLFKTGAAEAFGYAGGNFYQAASEVVAAPANFWGIAFNNGTNLSTVKNTGPTYARVIRRIPIAQYTAAGSPAIGSVLAGGFYGGQISTTANGVADYALIVAPNIGGSYQSVPGSNGVLTIAGADADGFYAGNTISNGIIGASAASGVISSINSTTVTLFGPATNWANGQNLYMGVPIVDVTGDTINLTSYFIPQASLTPSSTYYARVKYSSLTTSSNFSPWASFGTAAAFIPTIGQQLGGGYFAGQINDGGTIYNLIVAPIEGNTSGPATGGALKGQYGGTTPTAIQYVTAVTANVPADQNEVYGGTTSDRYKASGVHPLFNTTWLSGSSGPNGGTINLATGGLGGGAGIGGYTDWYVPAKNELEILYYDLKPTTTTNSSFSVPPVSGTNPNSVPPRTGYNSTANPATNPAQTTATTFQGSNAQAFSTATYYWSSSEFSTFTSGAWIQRFDDGAQNWDVKGNGYYARAIRRVQA